MVLVHPEAFYAGRDLVISGVTVTKGTELTPTQVGKFKHLDALVDRGWITVDPDPHQRDRQSPFGPHSSATMVKDRTPRMKAKTATKTGGYKIPASEPGPAAPGQVVHAPSEPAPVEDAPSMHNVYADLEVLDWVGNDPARAQQALAEEQKKPSPDRALLNTLERIAYPPPEPAEQLVPDIAYDESWTIAEVKTWVGDDVDRALEAYTREQMRGAGMRSTLIDWLTPILANVPQA